MIPGFYLALGDQPEDDGRDNAEPEQEVRFYWHLTLDAAVTFMAAATSLLNESRLPFRLKVLSDPGAYHRADAGVLYVHSRDTCRIAPILTRIYSAVADGLRPDVPLFAKRLRPRPGACGQSNKWSELRRTEVSPRGQGTLGFVHPRGGRPICPDCITGFSLPAGGS